MGLDGCGKEAEGEGGGRRSGWKGGRGRFLRIASGVDNSAFAVVARLVLIPFSQVYGVVMAIRGALYRSGVLRSARAACPVISVGNITVGGTGKTPMVAYLARFLEVAGLNPAVLMRGYRPIKPSGLGDEAVALQRVLPNVSVLCNRDRVGVAKEAVLSHGADVLLLDDGFQHQRLARDLDVVTVDALCPFGGGKLLPAGLLREPLSSLRRADVIVLTRTDQACEKSVGETERRLRWLAPKAVLARSVHRAVRVIFPEEGEEGAVSELSSRRVAAFCGIGRPESFRRTVESVCGDVVLFREFPDHYGYRDEDLREVGREARDAGAELIVTTEKDYARMEDARGLGVRLGVIAIELVVTSGEDELQKCVMKAVHEVAGGGD
jgi:tetraacyldisaccharide 4'-kinase